MSTIRFQDLGKPIQKLLKQIKGGYTDEDLALMSYVSVKDMVKIYNDLNEQKQAELIWKELKQELERRKEEQLQQQKNLEDTKGKITGVEDELRELEEQERRAEEKRKRKEEKARKKRKEAEERRLQEEEEEKLRQEEEDRLAAEQAEEEAAREARREERRRKREEKERQLKEEEERLRQEEEEEELRRKEEKKARKAERKRKQQEADELRRREEEMRGAQEAARAEKEKKKNLAEQWKEHIKNHPLEFNDDDDGEAEIVQKGKDHQAKGPPKSFLSIKHVKVPAVDEQEEATFFVLEVVQHSGKKISVKRRYNQFFEMKGQLGGTLDTLDAPFPGKTFMKVRGAALEKRRLELELWINNVVEKLATTRSYAGVHLDSKQQLRGDAARAEAEKQRMRQAGIAKAALYRFCGIED